MTTALAVHEQDIPQQKIDLIKQTVARGTTDLEFELFLHACKRTGLDPLMKQIYAIKRKNNKTGKEDMSIQTGIDGYRLIADRTGQYAGSEEPFYALGEDKGPDVATVTVYKMVSGVRCPFGASARWTEYYSESSPMWKKMPFLMLGKCAEALALRKAFPAELSGVYTHEEMDQAENEPRATVPSMATLQDTSIKVVQEKLQASQANDKPSAFVWQVGQAKGKRIEDIELSYLEFYISDKNKYPKKSDHVAAAKAELGRVACSPEANQPKISALCEAYLENITASETVTECEKSLADALTDEHIKEFEAQHIKDTAERKIALLRG